MRTSRFTNQQIVQALRQAESGTSVADICRKLQVPLHPAPSFP